MFTTAQLDATGHRWVAALAAYDFVIKYKPGKQMADADAMSRHPGLTSTENDKTCTLSSESIKAICQATHITTIHRHFTDKCRSYESHCGTARYEVCRYQTRATA